MTTQMKLDERKRLVFFLQLGWTSIQIAKQMGRSKTTIIREIINRSIVCNKGYKCSNRICALFDHCPRIKGYGRDAKRSFRCTPNCVEVCPDFVERTCEKLSVPSHVCNGCENFKSCPMMKRVYVADGAQANRDSLLHAARAGIHPDAETLARMTAILSPCILRGQSIRNVIANNKDVFGTVKERTVYDYIASGFFDTLTQDDINLVASHVASYTRDVLDDKTPYDVFTEKFGDPGRKLLDALGIVKIPANEVSLNPILLGAKFKRHADSVILRKAGVILTKNNEERKL